ncbi:MAG: hypothetical protein K9L26_02360 [Candidatus Izimaplasma sp.]|nr:hypothetical protein [Candidatus Izimaplasma bacterium]
MMGGYQGYSILWIGGFFLFILLVFGALLYVITKDMKKPKTDILEVRLAKGEINIDEYYEIKKLLRK